MNYVTTRDGTEIFYKDWGHGQPIVFHHGWPLSGDDWDSADDVLRSQGLPRDRARPAWSWPFVADRSTATRWTLTPRISPR